MSEAPDVNAEALADEPVTDQVTDTELSGEDAAAAAEDGEGEQPRPRRSAQERINEAVRGQREAERRAEERDREAEHWRIQALRNAPQPQAQDPEGAGEPDPTDYEHGDLDARFIRDHATFHATRTFREESARAEVARQQRDQLSAFDTNAAAAAQKHPDSHEVVGRNYERAASLCTDAMRQAIISSEDGPSVAYHLASNPDEARRIAALDPISQIRALGRLEATLANPAAPPRNPATNAPAATPQVRGAGGRYTTGPRDDQSMSDWLDARNAQLGR